MPALKVDGRFVPNPLVITDRWVDDGQVVYGDFKTGADRDAGKAMLAQGEVDLSRLDAEVDALVFKLANTMPGCLTKTIESVRKHKLEHWDRNTKATAPGSALNMMTEARAGFRAFHEGSKACREADFLLAAPATGRGRGVGRRADRGNPRGAQASTPDDRMPRTSGRSCDAILPRWCASTPSTPVPTAAYWARVFESSWGRHRGRLRVGLAAEAGDGLAGYLLGDVRAFEFGSEPCGWIFAVGVDPAHARRGVASALLAEAVTRLRAAGVTTVRTMVRRNDVPVLAFFRTNGFAGGPYVQLELVR